MKVGIEAACLLCSELENETLLMPFSLLGADLHILSDRVEVLCENQAYIW